MPLARNETIRHARNGAPGLAGLARFAPLRNVPMTPFAQHVPPLPNYLP